MEQITLGEIIFTNSFVYIKQTKTRVVFTFSKKPFNIHWRPGRFSYCDYNEDLYEFLIRRALPAVWKIL